MEEPLTQHPGNPTRAAGERQAIEPRNPVDDELPVHSVPARSLPSRADRQKVMDQAHLVLAEARRIAEQSDRTLAPVPAEPPGGTRAGAGG